MSTACSYGTLESAQWLYDHGAAVDVRTADKYGWTPMFYVCFHGEIETAQWLFDHGAAEDVRIADENGWTPMFKTCENGNLDVYLWLVLNGAANNVLTGHVDEAIIGKSIENGEFTSNQLRGAMENLLADHSNFITLVLSAVCGLPRLPLPASSNGRQNKVMRASNGPCYLPKLRGLESSVVAHISDFVGVVRGRHLRNLREAHVCLSDNMIPEFVCYSDENVQFDSDTEDFYTPSP